ncbi:MAG TPA: coenzyme F420-0:L-glutamate ligase [Candidatus Paceibacterota bacterium]|nr:coenzyme F420-0:L-glutamate ligase [Candidatus Paceibacterota bacterium]
MDITPIKIGLLVPPKDVLFSKIVASKLKPKNGDIIAVSSKVVSIHEGRCVPVTAATKDALAKQEAELYLERKYTPGRHALHTIINGVLIRSAGIDESNAKGHFILWPQDPMRSAKQIRAFLLKEYKLKQLGVIITDSISSPLRRGAIGFALAWAGFEPLYDYRGAKDLFGRKFNFEQANLADALAASAVLVMGEGSEQTPLAVIRNAPGIVWKGRKTNKGWHSFKVPLKEDLFAPFLTKAKWKKGKPSALK